MHCKFLVILLMFPHSFRFSGALVNFGLSEIQIACGKLNPDFILL